MCICEGTKQEKIPDGMIRIITIDETLGDCIYKYTI